MPHTGQMWQQAHGGWSCSPSEGGPLFFKACTLCALLMGAPQPLGRSFQHAPQQPPSDAGYVGYAAQTTPAKTQVEMPKKRNPAENSQKHARPASSVGAASSEGATTEEEQDATAAAAGRRVNTAAATKQPRTRTCVRVCDTPPETSVWCAGMRGVNQCGAAKGNKNNPPGQLLRQREIEAKSSSNGHTESSC